MDSEFYDLVYEAWRNGRNPDAVREDRFDDYLACGYLPDEISLNMILPPRSVHPEDERE